MTAAKETKSVLHLMGGKCPSDFGGKKGRMIESRGMILQTGEGEKCQGRGSVWRRSGTPS